MILETTMSEPCSRGRVPWDMYVPRPKTWLVNPTGGVAAPGTALTATNSPTNPTAKTARRMTRVVSVLIRDSFTVVTVGKATAVATPWPIRSKADPHPMTDSGRRHHEDYGVGYGLFGV